MTQRCLRNKLVRRFVTFSLASVSYLAAGLPSQAVNLVQEFYLPMPESQIYQANNAIVSGTSSTINSTFSIVVTGDGTVIYYDQWEDGYETDLANPTQSTTQIWGDGNDAHGIPPGFAHNPLGLPAGTVITLTNNVPQPRNPSQILWDARDRIAATKALVISRAGWPVNPGPVFAGAVGVLSTIDYGTNYIVPVGQDMTNNLFKRVGLFVMAAQNNTAVTVDTNGTGIGTLSVVLNQGESYFLASGMKKGGRVTASKPVQADMIVGHAGVSYAADWFTLYPVQEWSSSYYTPVSSAASGSQPAYVYLFNPNSNAIVINYATKSGFGSFSVPGTNGVTQFQMPIGSGASFVNSNGQNFFAICTVAANPAADTSYNWGFTLVPQTALTTEAVVGWGPGSADGTVDGSPVWVTALANTLLYVDYKGDHLGPLIDPNGNHYDTNFTVTALQSQKIYDPSKNQTGMRIYTLDGTQITAAWGEDPDVAQPGNPYIDAGTTVLPFPVPTLNKTAVIVTDTPPVGLSVGDTIAYTVTVDNKGLLPLGNTLVIDAPSSNLLYMTNSTTYNGTPIPDSATGTAFPLDAPGFTIPVILSQGTSTFTYLCKVTGGGVVSNSINIGGTSIFSSTSLVPAPASGATVSLNFTDTNGVSVSLYSVGANVYVTMTNAVGNTSSNSVQTIPVTVMDVTHGDLQTITLTETGTNTGVFRNVVGLPTSASAGLAAQDGILNIAPGDLLSVNYTDPTFGDSATNTATIQIPALTKQLYLCYTNGPQALDRIDPVAYGHSPTRAGADLGLGGAWPYWQAITINHTNVFGTDQTNFPVLINLAANTGLQNHAQASGNDIRFTASDGVTVLPYEREKYTSGTGALIAWVNVPILSHTTDTVLYMYYGNGAAADQQNVGGVWDTNYKGVWHLDQTPTGAAGDMVDSTGGNNGTSQTIAAGAQVAGKIGGSLTLDGTSDYISTAAPFTNPPTVMVEAWVKTTTTSGKKVVGFENAQTGTGAGNYDRHIYFGTNGHAYFGSYNTSSSTAQVAASTNVLNDGQWHFLVGYRDNAASIIGLYVDGVLQATTASSAGQSYIGWYRIGDYKTTGWPWLTGDGYFSGSVDEIKVSHFVRSPGWIQTEYTNQASPNTFYSIGTEAVNNTNVTTFAQSQVFCSNFIMPSNNYVYVTNYITVTNGVMPANPAVTAILQYGGTNIATLSNPTYSSVSSNLVWSGVLASNITVPAGQLISYVISNAQPGIAFHVNYDSTTAPSKIILPAATVIAISTLGVYDAPYPNGNLSTTPAAGSTVYVRANITDPFGSYDITSLGLVVTGPTAGAGFSTNLTDSSVVANDGCSKTYEFAWSTGPTTGNYAIAATANEGTEGITASAGASLSLIFLDLGVPSATVFTAGTNGPVTNSYPANGLACVRVTALDSITNPAIVQVIPAIVTSSAGDSEKITLTETGTNSGIYTCGLITSTNSGTATNDGTLFATVGSVITVSYTDPNNAGYSSSATAIITPLPGVPGVVMSKTLVGPTVGQVSLGQPVTYNLQVINTGSILLTNVIITDNFPTNRLSYTAASLAPTSTNVAGILTWTNLGTFSPGQSTNIVVTFTALASGSATNSATANGGTVTNSSIATILVTHAALNITKVLLSPATTPVAIGSNVVFRITIQNVGDTVIPMLPFEDNYSGTYYQYVSATIPPNGFGAGSLIWTNLAYATALATNAIITNDITMLVVGAGNPANNTAVADYAVDTFGNPVPTATTTTGIVTTAASIVGHVYNDINQSGIFTNGDNGLSGVTLELFTDPNGDGNPVDGALIQMVTTDDYGYYELLNLPTGHYVVVETDLPGYANSVPANGRLALNLTTLTVTNNNNFFQYQPSLTAYSTISGTVWNDANGNGTNDLSETGLANAEVDLVQDVNSNGVADAGEPVSDSVLTDANGNYSFAGVTPGHYVIRQSLFYGYYSTGDSQGRTDGQISFVSTNGIVSTNNSYFDRLLPIAVNDTNTALYYQTTVINPLTNDISFNGDTLTVAGAYSTNGIVVINPGSTNITFIPTNTGISTITYTNSDGHGGTSTAIITVNVTALADLAIGKAAAATVFAGSNLTYTISVTNFGPSGASGVVVTDSLPANAGFVSATGGGVNNSGVVNWSLGVLTNGQVSAVTVTVTAPAGGSLTNAANVTSPTSDPNLTNNVTPPVVTSVTPLADVAVSKTGPVGIIFGTNFNYTILVTNSGPSTATALSVTDSLPAGLTFVSSVPVTTTNTSNQVIWTNLGSLVAGGSTNLTLTVIPTLRGSVTNFASAGSPTLDPVPTNNVTPPVITSVTNNPPLANPDSYAMTENTTNTFSPLINDLVQTPGGSLTLVAVSTTNGVVTLLNGTNVVFTPATNFVGTTTIGYTITDNVGGTNNSIITVLVTNIPPLANPDSYTVLENSTNTFSPLTNDVVRTLGGVLQVIGVSATNGTATIVNLTNVIFTPTNNFTGTATIGYTMTDSIGGTNSSVITVTVLAVADLAVSKSAPANVFAATNFNYLITITNLGPGAAASLSVTDNLPSAVNLVSATAGSTLSGSQLVWTNLGSLAANAATNLTVTVTAPLTAVSLTNLASAGSPTSDPNPTNNTSPPVVTGVTPIADLVIFKTAPATVFAVSNLTYSISVTNLGPSSASAVVVTDALPAGVTFVNATGGGANNAGLVNWNFGALVSGQASNVTVTVIAPASGTLTNIASVSSPTTDTNLLNNLTPPVITAVTTLADLAIGKTAPASVLAASNLTYTISVTNFGPSVASAVVVTDSVPVGATFAGASGGGVNQGGSVTWSLGDLANGAVSNVTLSVIAPASGSLTNVAQVGSPTADPNPTNNFTPPVFTAVTPLADLVIAKTGSANVFAASNLSYTISVTNLGPSSASAVVVTDALPAGVTFVSASGSYAVNSGVASWNLGTLAAGQSSNLNLTVTAPTGGTLTNVASVSSPTGDTNLLNNTTPPVITSVTPLADVAVGKTGPAGIIFGTNFNYTISVTNFGPSAATSLAVTDNLPTGLVFVSSVPTTTTNSGNQIIWTNLGSLIVGGSTNLTVTVIATSLGSVTNIATAGSPTLDPVPTNNVTPPVVTAVTNNPPLANPDSYAITENTTNSFSPLLNDSVQTPGGSLTIIGVATTNGTATISGTNVIFAPTPNYVGLATIGYTITDNVGGTNHSLITVLVTNIPPVANPDSYTVPENSTNTFSPLVNDVVQTPGGILSLVSVSTTNGTATINGTNVIFAPANNFVGLTTLTYTITDGIGGTNSSVITVNVTGLADIAVSKNGPATVYAGTNFNYVITVTNLGPDGITSLSVTDNLPSAVSLVSATTGATLNGSQLIWANLGSLAAGAATNLTVTVTAPNDGASLTNIASGGSPTDDPDPTNNTSSPVFTSVTPVADLAIGKTAAATVFAASNLSYTISVTNLGPSSASAVVVTDALPAGVSFVNASGSYAVNSGVVSWNLGTLASGQISNVILTVTAPASGVLTNVASVNSPTLDPNPTNNLTPPVITGVTPLADVSVSKTGPAGILFGTNFSYAIAVTNFGPSTATALVITDSLPAGLMFVSSVPATTTNAGNQVIWSALGDLAAGASTNLTVTVIATVRGSVTNVASGGSPTLDPVPTNNATPPVVTVVTNNPPLANPDSYAMTENTTNSFSPLVNDTVQTPGGSLTIIGVAATNGAATVSGTNVIFVPTPNFVGVATIGYTITDNVGGTNSSLITVLVTNLPPLANPDSYVITENTTNSFSPLLNDVVQTPGGSLSLLSVAATNGTATINGTNVSFTPTLNFIGIATIGYTITDGIGGTNYSLITVTVTNVPPLANPDFYSVAENSTNTFSPLVNDVVTTPGGSLTMIGVNPTNGSATITGTNVTFVPTLNFVGVATIGYTITDNVGGTNHSLITVNVTNVPPVAFSQSGSTTENTAFPLVLAGSDPAGHALTFSIVTAPTNGTLTSLNTNTGAVIYQPGTNYAGADTFTFRVNNGYNFSPAAAVSLTVAPAADLSVAQFGPASAVAGSNLVFTVTVTNLGPAGATNLVITNQLATGFNFVSASAGGNYANHLVTWAIPALAANGVTNLTVTLFATEGGAFTNLASGASAVLDLNPPNNNGSFGYAQTRTVISALADVAVFKTGGTNVFAGQLVNYVITATNAGPSTATNVVVTDTLPAGAIFQSATGSYVTNSGVVTWTGVTLPPGTATTFNLTLLAPASVNSFVNIAAATSPTADPNPTNNNGSLPGSRVSTKVTPSADLAALLAGPASAILGSNIVYTITVTNIGPSVASNVMVSDSLPTNLLFVSASSGGMSNNFTITWPQIISLPVGGSSNYTFTVRALAVGTFTEIASALAVTADPNPTNNTGVLPASQAQTLVALPQFGLLAGAPVFNPQTGLYEESVTVTNSGPVTVAGIQLYVGGLRSGVSLANAIGTNGGVPFVQYNFPLNPSNTVQFVLEFYNLSRLAFTNTLTVVAIIPTNSAAAGTNYVAISKIFTDTRTGAPRFILEWNSIPGKTYTILYANVVNPTNWFVGTPSVTATANITQWYDTGPPATMSPPLSVNSRFYRIIQN